MELVYCTMLYHVYSNMGASTNGGTPQCRWCRMENRSINGRFGGIPILGNRNYMEVVYITWLFISVGLTSKKLHAMGNFRLYGRYLQSRFLKWPLKYYNYWFQYVWLQRHYSMCLTLHLELRPKLDFTELKAGWIFSGETEKKLMFNLKFEVMHRGKIWSRPACRPSTSEETASCLPQKVSLCLQRLCPMGSPVIGLLSFN